MRSPSVLLFAILVAQRLTSVGSPGDLKLVWQRTCALLARAFGSYCPQRVKNTRVVTDNAIGYFFKTMTLNFTLTSTSFSNGGVIPAAYAHTGYGPGALNKSPNLVWSKSPAGTVSFALICQDPDARGGNFVHWVIYNIPDFMRELPEGIPPVHMLNSGILMGTQQGINDYQTYGYGGPLPPVGTGVHRYIFTLYALDTVLSLSEAPLGIDLLNALTGHVRAQAELTGVLSALPIHARV
jgi:Raf kinase inhibitor-like YbhB/YbcL family protein